MPRKHAAGELSARPEGRHGGGHHPELPAAAMCTNPSEGCSAHSAGGGDPLLQLRRSGSLAPSPPRGRRLLRSSPAPRGNTRERRVPVPHPPPGPVRSPPERREGTGREPLSGGAGPAAGAVEAGRDGAPPLCRG